jgi:hypothetical protein
MPSSRPLLRWFGCQAMMSSKWFLTRMTHQSTHSPPSDPFYARTTSRQTIMTHVPASTGERADLDVHSALQLRNPSASPAVTT